jgi:hypothetical protein
VLAADVRAGEAEALAQEIAEEEARFHVTGERGAVHRDLHSDQVGHRATTANVGRDVKDDSFSDPHIGWPPVLFVAPVTWRWSRLRTLPAGNRQLTYSVIGI